MQVLQMIQNMKGFGMDRFPKGAGEGLGEGWKITRITQGERKTHRALFAESGRAFHEVGKWGKEKGRDLSMTQKQNERWCWEHP